MSRTITITLDQLYRAQPGGIGTYVRGLLQGLGGLDQESLELIGLAPRGPLPAEAGVRDVRLVHAALPIGLLTRVWPFVSLGVESTSDVVHATSMAGPYDGGRRTATHSVAMHDLLWRDEPSATTTRGIRFHERRLRRIVAREDLRVIVTSPDIRGRLVEEGIHDQRIYEVRLGVDDQGNCAETPTNVRRLLADRGVEGPFTFYAGTREPRKNLDRLVEGHRRARRANPELGALVLAGPSGWGDVATGNAIELGMVSRAMLQGLYREASVFAYVPRAEGWGLPPVEALHAGARVVASTTTPSVRSNTEVVRVDPLDVDAIANGLAGALELDRDEASTSRRMASVEDLTWRNAALDHLAAWR